MSQTQETGTKKSQEASETDGSVAERRTRGQRGTERVSEESPLHSDTGSSMSEYAHPLLRLQRTHGNQGVQRLVKERIQPKLEVGEPGDRYEREADRVAEGGMRVPESAAAIQSENSRLAPRIQRLCSRCQRRFHERKRLNCTDCEEKLQHNEGNSESRVALPGKQNASLTAGFPDTEMEGERRRSSGKMIEGGLSYRDATEVRELLAGGHVRAKLKIAPLDDPLEREADDVAAAVVQRTKACSCGGRCEEYRDRKRIRLKRTAKHTHQGTPRASQRIVNRLGTGHPLDPTTRRFFESNLQHDFGETRVHTDSRAQASARSINARAFTYGNHVAFAPGEFNPRSKDGRELLAHELTHVVQQQSAVSERVQRAPDSRQEEIERSKISPGMFTGRFPPLSFSLYRFAINEATLKSTHRELLAELGSWLSSSSAPMGVAVVGHADETGDEPINEPLSVRRAQAVVDVLASYGVTVDAPRGFGARRPVASNETETGRARNRRVDLIVYVAESRIEPEPESELEPEILPPEETRPPEKIDDGWFCSEYPLLCAGFGPGAVAAIMCMLFPEVCAALDWPEWPEWPEWPWEEEEGEEGEEGEEEEQPECGDPELPLTHVEFIPATGDKGNAVEAKPLTMCPGNTTGSPAKRNDPTWPYGWECIDAAGQNLFWARAHLLHHGLHGPGNDRRNIIISDKSINGLMYRRIEQEVEDHVWNQRQVLYYRVQVHHMTGSYPRPYVAEQVDMEFGLLDPITGDETLVKSEPITSNVGLQPPLCVSTPEEEEDVSPEPEPTPEPVPEEEPPQYTGPTIGPAPDDLVPVATPVNADCGRISCIAMDHYRTHLVITADERMVTEMIRLEMRFLKETRFATEYRLLELTLVRRGAQDYFAQLGALDARVETAARRRVFDFLVNQSGDPSWSLGGHGSVEGWVRSDVAR